jgi:hypothetical protein
MILLMVMRDDPKYSIILLITSAGGATPAPAPAPASDHMKTIRIQLVHCRCAGDKKRTRSRTDVEGRCRPCVDQARRLLSSESLFFPSRE